MARIILIVCVFASVFAVAAVLLLNFVGLGQYAAVGGGVAGSVSAGVLSSRLRSAAARNESGG